MVNPRFVATQWLAQVTIDGLSVNQLFSQSSELSPQQTALAKQLLFGCLRYYHQLQTLLNTLLDKPLKPKDSDIGLIILLGLYQLKYLSTPDHAAISESVELAKLLNKPWAKGLINAVLRGYQRQSEQVELQLAKSLQFQFSHSGWMIKRWRQDWSHAAEDILHNNNLQAPMVIRVNTQQYTRSNYLKVLEKNSIVAFEHPVAPDALVLDKAVDVYQLPGFEEGGVTIQDAAAQLAVEMLDLKAGQTVLDGCAAPGGKTTHILQRESDVKLTAVELSASRAEKIKTTLTRMNMSCEVIQSNILDGERWWNGELFDRILLDVPCTAVGVIRRNPDIKIHRKTTDVEPTRLLQQKILEYCWQLLKPGGKLVYATCSTFKDENQHQIEAFKQKHNCELLTMPENIHQQLSHRASVGYQIFPGELYMDGFYLCGLQKATN